jgi:hypothetical protein
LESLLVLQLHLDRLELDEFCKRNHLLIRMYNHRIFQSVEQLKNLLDRLLNQGELMIKWYRKVKNKGDAVIAN